MLFVHLSDIHFRSKEINRRNDPNAGLRDDMIADITRMKEEIGRSADGILISGDIAFAGEKEEYEFAYKWLRSALCPAAGCRIEDVFVIPGNHDVDRKQAATPLHMDARKKLRDYPADQSDDILRSYLSDPFSAQLLFGPIENYNRFAAEFVCNLSAEDPKKRDSMPFAVRDWTLNDSSTLRLWGFNSVLVCDEHDAPGSMFVDPAAAQIVRDGPNVTHVVMCHHPYGWLKNGGPFRERIEAVAKLHLFGHEHTRRVEEGRRFTTIRAGAVHPDRHEPGWDPGYNWINLSIGNVGGKRHLDVDIWVRKREAARFIAVPDPDNANPWSVRHALPDWSPPEAAHPPTASTHPVETLGAMSGVAESTTPKAPITGRTVISKLFRLPEHVQRQLIVGLYLDEDGDQALKDYEFVLAAVRRAKEQNKLVDLSHKADEALGSANAV
ncbi:MAG: metallophosphoesterase [Mesorhizobium sp.]|uniref:metallophosphoesterase n=1 Tax=Mesorhizobium sp. TaxID=1871066 RepID=UPI000FEA74B8|nr:metallophosphoesterase [Mesorhizobium sp.]RWE24776.1 MAG: metallophosphoesterase [Mesorhizobium sp.]